MNETIRVANARGRNVRKTSQNCVDGGTGRFMHAVSVRRNAKIEQKLFDSEAYFRIAHPKTVPKFDVSLESMIIDISAESTKIRHTCVLRGKADAASRSVGIFKSNRTSCSPSWPLVQLKLRIVVKQMDLERRLPFSSHYCRRGRLILYRRRKMENEYTRRSITAERNFNARSFDEFAVDFPERVSDGFDGGEDSL